MHKLTWREARGKLHNYNFRNKNKLKRYQCSSILKRKLYDMGTYSAPSGWTLCLCHPPSCWTDFPQPVTALGPISWAIENLNFFLCYYRSSNFSQVSGLSTWLFIPKTTKWTMECCSWLWVVNDGQPLYPTLLQIFKKSLNINELEHTLDHSI